MQDRVLIKLTEAIQVTQSGIHIPGNLKLEVNPVCEGTVAAVGFGRLLENGVTLPHELKVGDTVFFPKYTGSEIKIDNKDHVIIRESDVLCVVEQEG